MNDNIIAGLISGTLVTLFVVVFRAFWKGTIVPWFEDRVYKDVRIEGTWFTLYPTVIGERQETVTLERHGHEVTGSIICVTGGDEGERYNVHGSFRNLILTLLYESRDQHKVDRGTITLRCAKNGEELRGKVALYHDCTDSIDHNDVIWFRSKDEQKRKLDEIRELRRKHQGDSEPKPQEQSEQPHKKAKANKAAHTNPLPAESRNPNDDSNP